jgi:hypothetical protein
VLLPGVSVLARLVSEVRTDMSERLYSRLAGRGSAELGQRLDKLLTVPSGSRVSELDRLRRAPTRASGLGLEMVRALDAPRRSPASAQTGSRWLMCRRAGWRRSRELG